MAKKRKVGAMRILAHDLGGMTCAVCRHEPAEGVPQINVEVWSSVDLNDDDTAEIGNLNFCETCAVRFARAVLGEVDRG